MNKDAMKTDGGRLVTQALFWELNAGKGLAQYTLKEDDIEREGSVYTSLKKLYMSMEDPTEYTFAMNCFCSWQHWERIRLNGTIRKVMKTMGYPNGFDDWAVELEVKLRAEAVAVGRKAMLTGNFQATKWVAEYGWKKRKAGAPSKEEKERQAKIEQGINKDVDEIMRNAGLQ